MNVYVDGVRREIARGSTVLDAVIAFSPFGDDPVIVVHNGVRREAEDRTALADGDRIAFYPLLVGG